MFRMNKKIVVVGIIIFILLFGAIFLLGAGRKKTPTPVPTTTSGVSWQGLVAGKSTKDQVNGVLGNPLSETSSGNQTTNTYSSLSETRPNSAVFDNNSNTALFLRQIVSAKDTKTTKDIVDVYGETNTKLYGLDWINGIYLFVYLDKGIAYLANPDSNTLFEVWYFPPTTLDNFLKTWATDYSTQPKNQPF